MHRVGGEARGVGAVERDALGGRDTRVDRGEALGGEGAG